MRTLTTLLFTFLLVTAGQAQKAKLSLNLEEGKTYKHINHSTVTINQDVYGQKMNIEIIFEGSMSFLVKAVSKEAYEIEASYDWMTMKMDMPQMAMDFSSEKNDESDIFSSILAEMKNKPLGLKMDKRGKILEIEDVEERWSSIIDQFDQFPETQREQVKSQLLDSYGTEAIKGSIETATAVFPEKSVKKGAQWSAVTKMEATMPSTISTTYTFEGIEADLAIISSQATIESTDKEAYVMTQGMEMKYDMSGTLSSKIKLDKITGWVSEVHVVQEIKGTATIKESEQMPQAMEIPMIIKSETDIKGE